MLTKTREVKTEYAVHTLVSEVDVVRIDGVREVGLQLVTVQGRDTDVFEFTLPREQAVKLMESLQVSLQ